MTDYSQQPIRNWALEDRPREKMMQRGLDAMTDAELIAIILGSGTQNCSAIDLAKKVLKETGGLKQLATANLEKLTKIKGIGPAKAISLMSAFELSRRKICHELQDKCFQGSESAANYLINRIGDSEQEVFYALFLDRKNSIKHEKELSRGGVSATVIDVKLLFREACNHLASAIIVSHNHPSGNLNPSQADKDITQKIYQAGKIFDIPLLDHIIVTQSGYYSFADQGKLAS